MPRGKKEVGHITKRCGCGFYTSSPHAWFDHVKKVHNGGRRRRNKKVSSNRKRWRPKKWKRGNKPRPLRMNDDYL